MSVTSTTHINLNSEEPPLRVSAGTLNPCWFAHSATNPHASITQLWGSEPTFCPPLEVNKTSLCSRTGHSDALSIRNPVSCPAATLPTSVNPFISQTKIWNSVSVNSCCVTNRSLGAKKQPPSTSLTILWVTPSLTRRSSRLCGAHTPQLQAAVWFRRASDEWTCLSAARPNSSTRKPGRGLRKQAGVCMA